jgi:RNA polymerase sigma-70 factor (ECF subfamily)
MDDLEAVRRLKRGDIGGLEMIVSRYQGKAIKTAYLITQDEALAQDVVQDVFVRIFHRIRRFDESLSFEPYLMRSVVNAALNAIQKEARWVHPASNDDIGELENLISRAASLVDQVEDQVEFSQLKQKINTALSQLPARQRAVIVQRYYLEMSEKEMADALNAPSGTIKWLLNAARTRLRTLLGSERSAE